MDSIRPVQQATAKAPENAPDSLRAVKNANRRCLVKLALVGGASFVLGKVLGPSVSLFGGKAVEFSRPEDLVNFRLVETADQLKLFNKTGEEIMVIDKTDIPQTI